MIFKTADISARSVNRNVKPIAADNRDATNGRQTAAITSVALMPRGRPEYATAGMKRMNAQATNATATPVGPYGRPQNKAINCAHMAMKPQRIHRSVLPEATWSHPNVRSTAYGIPR